MFSETPLLQPIRPARHFHVIDEEQINQLANGTLEILAETGVHCPIRKMSENLCRAWRTGGF